MKIEFFIPLREPPSVTHQEHKVTMRNDKPVFYETQEQKAVRRMFEGYLAKYKPEQLLAGPVRLITKWIWSCDQKHLHGSYKTTKPDTDNLIKMFKDCMTRCGYWKDDAQVASEITEKLYGSTPGIYVRVEEL